MVSGVSTACLYPRLLEDSIYDLSVYGVKNIEIFFNTPSELKKSYVMSLKSLLDRFEVNCFSVHSFYSELEPLMFFSEYERRFYDSIEIYKKFFNAMNILEAKYLVFHGNKKLNFNTTPEFYAERFGKLNDAAKEFGVMVTQENVSRCTSGSIDFLMKLKEIMGEDLKIMLDVKQTVRSKENAFDYVENLKESIVGVHMSDHGENGDCLQIGMGRFNTKGFLNRLYKYNKNAVILMELYRSNFKNGPDLLNDCNKLDEIIANIEENQTEVRK